MGSSPTSIANSKRFVAGSSPAWGTNLKGGSMNKLLLVLVLSVLAGCGPDFEAPKPDNVLRHKIFLACLGALPKGPEQTVYNDWAEVVAECESAAYYQSLKRGI